MTLPTEINTPENPLPLFSVITPSYNQGAFIEQTIQSVLDQAYPRFEHIVIDGGSTDNTVPVLKRHPHLRWLSEKDQGQADALNKGFRMARGDVIAWINSDDYYAPGIFHRVAEFLAAHPDKNIVMGNCHHVHPDGTVFSTIVNQARGFDELKRFWVDHSIPTQPAIFFRRKLLDEHGELDPSLYYAMDYDLWLRFARTDRFHHLNVPAAYYRFHPAAKGGDQDWNKFKAEWQAVYDRYVTSRSTRFHDRLHRWFGKKKARP